MLKQKIIFLRNYGIVDLFIWAVVGRNFHET